MLHEARPRVRVKARGRNFLIIVVGWGEYRGTPALILRELRAGVREELLRFVREAVASLLR